MKFETWMSLFMALFFAVSAITMATAQIKGGEAIDKTLDIIINYENAKIVTNSQLKHFLLATNQLLIINAQLINKNHGCLGTVFAEKMKPFNQSLYEDMKNSCFYDDMDLNITYPDLNQTVFEEPIKSYLNEIKGISTLRKQAMWWQYGSIISFIFGIACFIFLIEKKVIDFSIGRK